MFQTRKPTTQSATAPPKTPTTLDMKRPKSKGLGASEAGRGGAGATGPGARAATGAAVTGTGAGRGGLMAVAGEITVGAWAEASAASAWNCAVISANEIRS